MKAKINVSFAAKLQVVSFNPVESVDSIELEIEYKDDEDLKKKIEHYQDLIRGRCINNAMKGVNNVIIAKAVNDQE